MNQLTEGRKPQTKRARFTSLLAFFNFAKNNLDPDFINPCDSPMLRKLFRMKVKTQFDILEKETVDEIIFRTSKIRNRLMLELMARGAMRIGEVLSIIPNDVAERKILLREPKSGRNQGTGGLGFFEDDRDHHPQLVGFFHDAAEHCPNFQLMAQRI